MLWNVPFWEEKEERSSEPTTYLVTFAGLHSRSGVQKRNISTVLALNTTRTLEPRPAGMDLRAGAGGFQRSSFCLSLATISRLSWRTYDCS